MPEDAAQLLDLIRQHALFERATARVTEAGLVSILSTDKPLTHLIVAEDGKSLIGYAAVTFDYALWTVCRFAHLDCLFVRETARGQGIGKRLFERACLLAEEDGAERIEWQTPSWNLDAIRFYQREGGTGQPKIRFSRHVNQPEGSGGSGRH
ncbi:N-acetyltransferase [Sinorhizobium sp. BJ1]|uniref:GCN5-like N-acetyltransferase n=1 Tax=Sinorhizobium fredii (strain USDA 257) TaxID=1185652 RepID=I3X9M1_SINF2|nr:GCN5-like N-acetyltransferase [Sinorhizobium fredii USDA 257]PDT84378.1 N-acetyltransferase [Sinorhizobium sp. BJ1]